MTKVQASHPEQYRSEEIAHALSILVGAVMLFFGLFRLGWIVEFVPYIAISSFVTAASITIMSTQIPTALGISGIDTAHAPYLVLTDTIKNLPNAKVDAAIGISSIVLLFAIRDFCRLHNRIRANHGEHPERDFH